MNLNKIVLVSGLVVSGIAVSGSFASARAASMTYNITQVNYGDPWQQTGVAITPPTLPPIMNIFQTTSQTTSYSYTPTASSPIIVGTITLTWDPNTQYVAPLNTNTNTGQSNTYPSMSVQQYQALIDPKNNQLHWVAVIGPSVTNTTFMNFFILRSMQVLPLGLPEPLNILGATTGLALFGTVSTALKRRKVTK